MKLSRNSRLIRWAYIMRQEFDIPMRTNICTLFWRIFLLSPLQVLASIPFVLILGPIALAHHLEEKGKLDWLLHRPIRWRLRLPTVSFPAKEARAIAWQRLKDWKQGVCTIVHIE